MIICQLIISRDGSRLLVLAFESAGPMNRHIDAFRFSLHRHGDAINQVPHDGLLIFGACGTRLPERWDVRGERPNGLRFVCAQSTRLLEFEARVLLFGCTLLDKRLLPLAFQFPSHQAILRFHDLVLPRCSLNIVAHSFQLLLPVTMKPGALQLDVFRRLKT